MDLQRFADVGDFLDVAGDFLVQREAEHNLILGICSNLRVDPATFGPAPYLAAVTDSHSVVAAAIQTPPFRLILSEVDDDRAIDLLADDLADRDLPGALGPVEVVRAFVEAGARHGGRPARLETHERIYQVSSVTRPQPVPAGDWRIAEESDRRIVMTWLDGFMREALQEADPTEIAAMTHRWLARQDRTLYLWEDDDGPVSLCGVGGPTPNGARIGPVYTPPRARNRGYASALVAAVSRAELDAGRRFLFLFTDLANPTANHIYQTIGYEPVRDVDVWVFERDV
jgi:uncharacterized protein